MSMAASESFKILSLPDDFYYIPNFITADEETALAQKINSAPKPKWTVLSRRRLQSYPSALTTANTLLAEALPTWLESTIKKLTDLNVWQDTPHGCPNHVLINEYKPAEGISPHKDGAAYAPVVATVSLCSHTVLEIWEQNEDGTRGVRPKWRILQEPRSLLVTVGDAYRDYQHGIAEIEIDEDLRASAIANWHLLGQPDSFLGQAKRETRLSLTFRDVLKVVPMPKGLQFGFKRG